jgi:hypothetical protein
MNAVFIRLMRWPMRANRAASPTPKAEFVPKNTASHYTTDAERACSAGTKPAFRCVKAEHKKKAGGLAPAEGGDKLSKTEAPSTHLQLPSEV